MQQYRPDPDHTPEDYYVVSESKASAETNPLWERENVTLWSVGIDIGSAGTQILFSRLHLKRQALDFSSRYFIVERETLFESPISLTPYASDTLIDARALGELVDQAYYEARLHPDNIDTGVVILTGEARRRRNAQRIATILSEKCGDLVCATAGHHMEATLAAYGSGAVHASFARDAKLLNVDIGGGTTKLSVIDRGRILSTAAVHIGSRLLAVDSCGNIERLEPAGTMHAVRAGLSFKQGQSVSQMDLEEIAVSMADDLVAILTSDACPEEVSRLYLTDPIEHLHGINLVLFSGGVAEFVYRREDREFGDLGKLLGNAVRQRVDDERLPWLLLSDSHGIRSTALGCSEYTAQLSGNTGYISNPDALLPRRNLKVLLPDFEFKDEFSPVDLANAIRQHMVMYEVDPSDTSLVLAFHWQGAPRHRRLRNLAEGIRAAASEWIEREQPVYVILDADVALNLGSILHRDFELKSDVMVIDGLELWNFDSIDLGKPREPSMTVPVTIKSLIFHDILSKGSFET